MTNNDPQPQSQEAGMATCPFCLSEIPAAARKCKHCGEWQSREESKSEACGVKKLTLQTSEPSSSPSVFEPAEGFPKFAASWGYIGAIVNFVFAIYSLVAAPEGSQVIVLIAYFIPSIVMAYFLVIAPAKKYAAPYAVSFFIGLLFSLILTYAVLSHHNPDAGMFFFVIGGWISVILSAYAHTQANGFINSEFDKAEAAKKYSCEFRKSQKRYPFCAKHNKYLSSIYDECKEVKQCFSDKGDIAE